MYVLQYIFDSILGLCSRCECVNRIEDSRSIEDNGDATQWHELEIDRWGDGCLAVCPDSRRSRPAHVHTSHQQTSQKTMLGIWPVGRQKPNMRCDARDHKQKIQAATPSSHHPLSIRLFLSSALIAADDLPLLCFCSCHG